jgi:ComF family protein
MLATRLRKFLPASCVFCGLPGSSDDVCTQCRKLLPWNECYCDICGQPLEAALPPGVACAECQARRPVFFKARSPLRYAFPIDVALKRLKFRRQTAFAPAFALLVSDSLQAAFADCDALVPVPLHRWRHATRGFNQADEIARQLAGRTGRPLVRSVYRQRATKPQSGLSAAARHRNLRDAFAISGPLEYRYPLIVDDVMTTGTTCNQLALTLLHAGAKRVGVLTVARSSLTQ